MASGKGADSTKSTTSGFLWGSLHVGGPRSRKCRKFTGKRSGLYKIDNFWAFVVFPPFRRSQKQGMQEIHRSLGNCFRKRSGHYKIDNFWAFAGFPLHFGGLRSRKCRKSTGALEMASGKGSGLYKIYTFWAFVVSLHFGGPRSRKCRKSTGALEMASGKGADSTKSTNFGLLWFPPFRRSQKPEIQQIHRNLGNGFRKPEIQDIHRGPGNGFRKKSGLYKIDKFWAFVGFPPFRRSQKPESRKSIGALKMASGKGADSTLSTTLGLLWGSPSISAVPEAGNAGNPQGPWKWLPEKGADSTKSTPFGLLWFPSISAVPEAGNAGYLQGLGNGFRKRSELYRVDNFWAFLGFPPFQRPQKPEIHRGLGHGFRKRSGLYKIDNFWVFVGFPPFRRFQKPEIQEIHRGLGNGFRKRSGLYKINKFWAFVVPSISAVTEAGNPANP